MPDLPGIGGDRSDESADAGGGVAQPDRPKPESLGPAASGDAAAQYQGSFEAFGLEPDWRLDLLEGWANFSRTGLEDVGGIPGERAIRARGAMVDAGPLVITLQAETCDYGASGQQLPYKVSVFYEGVTYDGCARPVADEGASAAGAGWAVRLPQMLPAVTACLTRAGEAASVTIAYEIEDGAVVVRLRERDGGRYECNVLPDGASITSYEPIGDRNVLQGEREPTFYPAPETGPTGACFTSQEVLGADGAPLGTLVRRTC
jgi:uncharacterized membrane protein